MAGFVAENILQKRLNVFYWNELEKLNDDDLILDVRSREEFLAGNIESSINIPVDDLRGRLDEIPKDKNIYIYCEAGLRGYLAQRTLKQSGYDKVLNLSGGYRLWTDCVRETELSKTLQTTTL